MNGILKVVPTADEQTLFYYDGERLTAYATGQGLANEANNVKPAALGDAVNRASFAEGRGDGTYLVTTGDRTLLFRGNEEVTRSGMNMPKSWPAQYLDLVPVDDISLHISETGYATFFAHQAMKLNDSSVKIYVAERNGTNSLQLTELTKGIIPAATAVILKADGREAPSPSRAPMKRAIRRKPPTTYSKATAIRNEPLQAKPCMPSPSIPKTTRSNSENSTTA